MKQVSKISCWTDYPFTELGDVANQAAPIRQVTVVAYDGDKYATIIFGNNLIKQIKSGYLYTKPVRFAYATQVNRRKLERLKSKSN